jgi:hypothetical protein
MLVIYALVAFGVWIGTANRVESWGFRLFLAVCWPIIVGVAVADLDT